LEVFSREDTFMASNYDENNSTVRWIPGFLRRFLGLDGDDRRPQYNESRAARERFGEDTVGWMPGAARRALGVDYSEPKRYPPSPTQYTPDEPVRRYTAPAAAPGGNDRMSFDRANERMQQMAAAVPPPAMGNSEARMREIAAQATYTPPASSGRNVTPGANIPEIPQTEGYVQPISFLLRAYARGSLPPQGLEQFTKELRATGQQLWEFYDYWLRFQTDELVKIVDSARGITPITPATKTTDDLDRVQVVPVETAPEVVVDKPPTPVVVVDEPISPVVVEPPPPPPPDAPANRD
jgi:hypothetical protein